MLRIGDYRFYLSPGARMRDPVAGVFLLLLGLYALVLEYQYARDVPRTLDWPSTTGTVAYGPDIQARRRRSGYRVDIVYRYAVGNRTYSGRDVWLHGSTGDRQEVEEVVRQLRAGRPTRVYYDPADPARSVLFPGATGSRYPVLIVLIPILAGTWGVLRSVSVSVPRPRR